MISVKTIKLLAVGGLIAIAGDVFLPFAVAIQQPGYDHLTQYMSELGVPGLAGATFISWWWIVSGVLTIGLGLALHLGTRKVGRLSAAGPLLVTSYGLLVGIGSGVFPCDPGCAGENLSGKLHDTVNAVGAMAQLVAPGVCWLRWRHGERWWGFRGWTIASQVVIVMAFVLFMALGEASHEQGLESFKGLYQRLFQGTFYLWLSVVTWKLIALRNTGLLDRAEEPVTTKGTKR